MNMRDRSQGFLRQVSALLITLSDNTFHITEHILFQKMWKRGHWRKHKCHRKQKCQEPQHMFLRAIKLIWIGKPVPGVIGNQKSVHAVEELEHVLSIDNVLCVMKVQAMSSTYQYFLGTTTRLLISLRGNVPRGR